MFPTHVCFEKYNEKDRSPDLFKRYEEPNLSHDLKVILETNMIGRKSRACETIRYIICGRITQI